MSNEKNTIKDEKLENVSGGAIRPKYVSSFFCEKCGKTIHLNGVYTLGRACSPVYLADPMPDDSAFFRCC